ncbi:ATP-dependent sacrificial sulfur transferase LarE [candidate division TA06 bacterium]|uniref:ATP-dependent sacrificial sulfur transferase LarE n=1 Tax=candidate division TA06 bacterium TaxID=2250710 RepID=A0A933IA26_UNCT6|nr:ATP-dependent sacrificial sulfur transferase LarE [candidate division TA06 bacterium]
MTKSSLPAVKDKLLRLQKILSSYGSAAIAYSGGVDSSLLALLVREALGNKHLAVTAVSQSYTPGEMKQARAIARKFGIKLLALKTDELNDPKFNSNPTDRCYHCKKHLFKAIKSIASKKGIKYILDGTNADDVHDFRPGRRAAEERGIKSPFVEVGMTKAEIRMIAKQKGLPNWDHPANACLALRIPYGVKIDAAVLKQVEKAEEALAELGLKKYRVRHHGQVARIEVDSKEFAKIIKNKIKLTNKIKAAGYQFVTLDLLGYQTGCFNPKKQ